MRFYRELVIKISFKDVDPLNSKSSLLILGILSLNRNKLYNIFIFKLLTSLKGNSKSIKITGFNANTSFLILIVKASTKNL